MGLEAYPITLRDHVGWIVFNKIADQLKFD